MGMIGNFPALGIVGPGSLSPGAPSWDPSGNSSILGNLALTGLGKRITGDFSNATQANRVVFQTSTTNGNTIVGAIPNGTATTSVFRAFNNSDPTNASEISLFAALSDVRLTSSITGTGTYLPLTLYTGGSERMRLDTLGNVGIGTSSPAQKLDISGTGAQIALRSTDTTAARFRGYVNGAESGVIGFLNGGGQYFETAGSERMRLDAVGNLGLGVTPSALLWPNGSAGGMQLQAGALLSAYNATTYLSNNWYYNAGEKYIGNGFATRYEQTTGKHAWYYAGNNTSGAGATVSWTQAMTLFSGGNFAVGTTTDYGDRMVVGVATAATLAGIDAGFSVRNVGESTQVRISRTGSTYSYLGVTGPGGLIYSYDKLSLAADTNNPITFHAGGSERARIDSSGNLLVGTTTVNGVGWTLNPSGSGQIRSSGTGSQDKIQFANTNGVVGAITTSGTSTAYNTSSDYRLKEDIQPMTGALAKVAALKPCTYKWKADGSDGEGFIAHELAEVVPQAVTGEKDAVDAEGKPVYQGIDTSFLVATLTAAIQELKAEFDAYKEAHP